MATIGLRNLYYVPITEDADGFETYGQPIRLALAISANLSVELAEATLYADDGAAVIIKDFKSGTLALGVDDIGQEKAAALLGAVIDQNGVMVNTDMDNPNYVAIGFEAVTANKKLRKFWLPRVLFAVPSTELETKGDSINFKTPTLNGIVTRRNKPDASGSRPWKYEVTEGNVGVSQQVLDGWFNAVYDSDTTVTPPTEPPTEPENPDGGSAE
jgi:phi13 family phage major tail protein